MGLPPEQVCNNTLVVRGARTGVALAVLAGDMELDFQGAREARGRSRRGHGAAERRSRRSRATCAGARRPSAARRRTPSTWTVRPSSCADRVAVSAGVKGTQIVLAPADYLRATGAKVGPIARAKG